MNKLIMMMIVLSGIALSQTIIISSPKNAYQVTFGVVNPGVESEYSFFFETSNDSANSLLNIDNDYLSLLSTGEKIYVLQVDEGTMSGDTLFFYDVTKISRRKLYGRVYAVETDSSGLYYSGIGASKWISLGE